MLEAAVQVYVAIGIATLVAGCWSMVDGTRAHKSYRFAESKKMSILSARRGARIALLSPLWPYFLVRAVLVSGRYLVSHKDD